MNKRWIYIAVVLVAILMISPFIFNLGGEQQEGAPYLPQVSHTAMDDILAEDLSLTTSMFMNQVKMQLMRWSHMRNNEDLDDETLLQQFEQEVEEHAHITAVSQIKKGDIQFTYGNIQQDAIEYLNLNENDGPLVYSDPFEAGGQQRILVAYKEDDESWLVSEVDLTFIQQFVGELGDVADANGNLFIALGETDVEVVEDEDPKQIAEKKVPELDWTIRVRSQMEEGETEQHYIEGEVFVKFNTEADTESWIAENRDFEIEDKFQTYVVLRHDTLPTNELIAQLQQDPRVESVEPNYIYTKQDTPAVQPNDEFFAPYQWNLNKIGVEQAWEITGGDEEVVIAILDTGVDMDHQDLRERLLDGYNAFDESGNYDDDQGHGTHVAGIAAAVTNNINGIAGISWENMILPVKVLDHEGHGTLFEITRGIIWATDQGASVINMSLGDDYHADMLYDAILYAYEHDVVLIGAAGNDNVHHPMYPAAYDEVLSVSATNHLDEKAIFSNFGDVIDVAAPGEHIPSTFMNNEYVFMSGTSMSAPHVAGMAGLIRSVAPHLTNVEVMTLIKETANDLGDEGYDPYFGHGQINVHRALERIEVESPYVNRVENQTGAEEEETEQHFFNLEQLFNRLRQFFN